MTDLYKLIFSEEAEDDFAAHRKAGDKGVIKKLGKFFDELESHPYTGTGKPEALKHELSGFYSRKINEKHRLVYKVDDEEKEVYIVRAWGHYEDK